MGPIVSSNTAEDIGHLQHIPAALLKTSLDINLQKQVNPKLNQLQNFSLEEIRTIYELHRQRSKSPFIDRSTFCHLVPFTRKTGSYIYQNYVKNFPHMNIFEFLSALILVSYTNYQHKIHLIFLLFDFDCSESTSLNELVTIFMCVTVGYCKITEAVIPPFSTIEKYAKLIFLKSDIQAENQLELRELIDWCESNPKVLELFLRFEPTFPVQESVDVLKHFKKYSDEEGDEVMETIQKFYRNDAWVQNQKMDSKLDSLKQLLERKSMDYSQQSPQLPKQKIILGRKKKGQTRGESVGRNKQSNMLKLPAINNNRGRGETQRKRMQSQNLYQETEEDQIDVNNLLLESALDDRKKIPEKSQEKEQKPSTEAGQQQPRKKILRNIIIMKGQTLSKSDIYKMKSYFDKISNQNSAFTIQDFQNFFTGERSHMKSDLTSIFNFLDKRQKGKVTFQQLLLRIYPQLPRECFKLINEWIVQFQRILSREQKSVIYQEYQQQEEEEKKEKETKKPTPFPVVQTIKDIFDSYDTEKKGYLSLENLKKKFTFGYTQFELDDVFKRFDSDSDGKMQFEDFLRFILPRDYTFEFSEKQIQILGIKKLNASISNNNTTTNNNNNNISSSNELQKE